MKKGLSIALPVAGGILGLLVVRYAVYSKAQITLWKLFIRYTTRFNFKLVDDFLFSDTGLVALLGIGLGVVLGIVINKYLVK